MPPPLLPLDHVILDRMVQAVEKVRERLSRATRALESSGVPYAVIGGNAVAAWVARVDPGAIRNTADVDILLRRADLEAAKVAMAKAGFFHCEVSGVDMFIDGPQGRPRDAVHVIFAAEKVRTHELVASPDVAESVAGAEYRLITLEALVRMKLTSYRRKDQVHIQDLLEVGLVDASWLSRVPSELAPRLQELLDDPNG
jgi:hypothetical protein